jgi:hypothetical protein
MLQAGRSRVQILMRSLDFFFHLPSPSSHTSAMGLIETLTEMSTSILPGGVKHDKAICLYSVTGITVLFDQP